MCLNFGSIFLAKHAQRLLRRAHIALDITCVYSAAGGTYFRTTDVYELHFSYLSICIFVMDNFFEIFLNDSCLL